MFARTTIIFFILLMVCAPCSSASELSARAAVESTEVYKGETFRFQIQVSGSDNPEEPDISVLKNFTVNYLGRSWNSISSMTMVDGRMRREEKKDYIFNYDLTPLKTGKLTIPSIEVKSGNDLAKTSSIVILSKEPEETDDFKLRLALSKNTCYTGEPVILTVTWYLRKDVRDFLFNIPVLNDSRFTIADPQTDKSSTGNLIPVPVGKERVVGEKGQGILEGSNYTTLTFKKVLIPEEPGSIAIEEATVSCSALSGYSSSRRNNSLSDFFDDDFFGSSRRAVYKTVVVPSNSLTLEVKSLPDRGRPANFIGHIGNYKIETSASPLKVNVGDPITLTIKLSGPEYLDHIEIPPLDAQSSFKNNFRIPDERASAEILLREKTKVFTQTIRPLNSTVEEIPSVELPYFDTEKGKYSIARSNPIKLSVDETRVVTLLDAEGASEVQVSGNDIETWSKGIAFNYEDMSVLEKHYVTPLAGFRNGIWPVLVFSPPLVFIFLLTGTAIYRKRNSDPHKVLSRKAFSNLKKSLEKTESASPDNACEMVLDSLREYLGIKLKMPSGGAVTFSDAREKLESSGIEKDMINKLKTLFESCEAGRYAGNITFKDNKSLINEGISIAGYLEKRLK
jgi:hypothetical protein